MEILVYGKHEIYDRFLLDTLSELGISTFYTQSYFEMFNKATKGGDMLVVSGTYFIEEDGVHSADKIIELFKATRKVVYIGTQPEKHQQADLALSRVSDLGKTAEQIKKLL